MTDHALPDLTRDEILRYSRHLVLPQIGIKGQRKLKAARVLLVGAGGLGSPIALYLAAAGIGHLGLVDPDVVSISNLQRQVLHGTSAVGEPKVLSGKRRLLDINPTIDVAAYHEPFTSNTAERIAATYHLIVDGTDNFPARYLINDVCLRLGIPFVYGAIFRMEGQVSLFAAGEGPCYRCVFPTPPAPESVLSCEEAGVLGVIPGTIGTLQATVAIQWILEQETPLRGALLVYDAARMNLETIRVSRDPKCAACSGDPSEIELIDYAGFCGVPVEEPELALPAEAQIEPSELKARMDDGTAPPVFDIRPSPAWEIFRLEGAVHTSRDGLLKQADALGKEAEFVAVCKIGRRSAQVVEQLRHRGFSRVRNLRGGLSAWARDVDPDAPVY